MEQYVVGGRIKHCTNISSVRCKKLTRDVGEGHEHNGHEVNLPGQGLVLDGLMRKINNTRTSVSSVETNAKQRFGFALTAWLMK